MNFDLLLSSIQHTHEALVSESVKAVNRNLTLRNWLIGFYIVEFEQNGEDRAQYGAKLLRNLATQLNIEGLAISNLKTFRQFYKTYPQLANFLKPWELPIGQSLTGQLEVIYWEFPIGQSVSDQLGIAHQGAPPELLVNKLSFSHFEGLLKIADPKKRAFYELLAIKGTLSVRELRRQIESLS